MRLSDFKVLSFDCYGTLIDWESGMSAALAPIASRAATPLSRDAILEAHARAESAQQRYTPAMPYRDLLAVVCKRLAEEWRAPATWDECVAYGRSIADWPAFPDSAAALAHLSRHFGLVILSNVDNASFAHSARRLGVGFDAICVAEDIGSYKPSPRNFGYMLEVLARRGIAPDQVLHVAESLFHDHAPANAAGLRSAWIHRRHASGGFGATMDPGTTPRYDFRFESMAALVAAHRAEQAG
jgi:2-haloacid dehalogenase/putative hydrolase of the HAD superfamily